MKARRISKALVSTVLCLILILGSVMPVFAAAPAKEDVEYEGNGRVEVEFKSDVVWKKPVVTVKDSSGKTYKATIVKRDNDDITFVIKGYKAGKKYNFTISGVKKRGTSGYGKVKGSFTIPKAAPKAYTGTDAKNAAINNAVKKLSAKKSTIRDVEVEKDYFRGQLVWEVSFDGKRTNKKGWYEFEYVIDVATGKILHVECERD